MAITVKIKEKEAKEITFPILMKHKTSDLVVLFTGKRTGFVLNENSTYEVGYYSDTWDDHMLECTWEPSPPITLSNS